MIKKSCFKQNNLNFTVLPLVIGIMTVFSLPGCSGGGGSSSSTSTGTFVDSPVAGLRYETPSHSGTTDANGEFEYEDGESVTFSIGDISFPATTGASNITPLDVFEADVDDTSVINMARFLQTLDEDDNPDNGIEITEQVHNDATDVSIDFSDTLQFESDVSSITTKTLVSESDAVSHLEENLPYYTQSDLNGKWISASLKTPQVGTSAPEDFGYDVDKLDVSDGVATITTIATPPSDGSSGDSDTFSIGLNEDTGVVTEDGDPLYIFMSRGKDIMVEFTLQNTNETAQQMGAWVKQASSYSQSDLEGTWRTVGLKTPQTETSSSDDLGYDVDKLEVDGSGNATLTTVDTPPSDGSSGDTDTFQLTIDSTGTISEDGSPAYAYMNARKDMIVHFTLHNTGEVAQQMDIFVKQASSYSQSDMEGTWRSVGLKTPQATTFNPEDFGYDVDKMVIDAEGNANLTQLSTSDGSAGDTDSFTLKINSAGEVVMDDSPVYAYLNASKDVMVSFSLLNDGEVAQQMDVWVKERE